jgi:peroxiredoxin
MVLRIVFIGDDGLKKTLVSIDAIKALGIDEIYCLSVNDAFVMRQVRD